MPPIASLVPSLVPGLVAAIALAPVAVDAVDAPDEAVITVRVGGDRISGAITDSGPASAAFTGVAGARLGLFAAPDDASPIPESWATCVSDAAGDCSFRVPGTDVGGANRDARFAVKQVSAPAGWSANPTLHTDTEDGYLPTPYRFLTGPELRAGSTYSSLSDFMYAPADAANLDNAVASSGVWQQSRTNPAVAHRCGLDLALIFDTSSSVGSALPQLIDAADTLVDALTGTQSRAAAFSFSALSPGAAAGPNHPELTSVSTAEGAAAFKHQYASWGISGGTSWDRGLFAAAAADEHYDLAVVITDGNPTSYGDPLPAIWSRQATRFKEVEYGIASANALKAEGTRVIALGVGTNIELSAISGPTAYDGSNAATADRFNLADYDAAAAALHDLVDQLCSSPPTFSTFSVQSLILQAHVVGVRDANRNGRTDTGDEISYEYGVTNVAPTRLENVTVVSPLLGAVVCPATELEPAASMTCTAHAPYVLTSGDVVAGSLNLTAHAEASVAGEAVSSADATMTTTLGQSIRLGADSCRWSVQGSDPCSPSTSPLPVSTASSLRSPRTGSPGS